MPEKNFWVLISIMDHIEEQQLQSKFLLVIFFVSAISVITGMVSAIRNNNMQGGNLEQVSTYGMNKQCGLLVN